MEHLNGRIQHLERTLLSDHVYALVREMIRDSTLVPGEKLTESKLARDFSVSQSPVREALRRLAHDGLIRQVRHHGSFVADFSADEVEAARNARAALEELAGRFVCGRLTPATRTSLESLIDRMRHAAEQSALESFRELDFEFHRAVVGATGNTYLPRMWDVLEPSLRSLQVVSSPRFLGDWIEAADVHRVLVRALDGEDPQRAADMFRLHASGRWGLEQHGSLDVPATTKEGGR